MKAGFTSIIVICHCVIICVLTRDMRHIKTLENKPIPLFEEPVITPMGILGYYSTCSGGIAIYVKPFR